MCEVIVGSPDTVKDKDLGTVPASVVNYAAHFRMSYRDSSKTPSLPSAPFDIMPLTILSPLQPAATSRPGARKTRSGASTRTTCSTLSSKRGRSATPGAHGTGFCATNRWRRGLREHPRVARLLCRVASTPTTGSASARCTSHPCTGLNTAALTARHPAR